jgi:hypothetical protein
MGGNLFHNRLYISKKGKPMVGLADKSYVYLADVARHRGLTPVNTYIFEVLEEKGISKDDLIYGLKQVFLIQAMTFEADEESLTGRGNIYSAFNYNRTNESRHDFVEVKVDLTDGSGADLVDANGNAISSTAIAQVITFIEVEDMSSKISTYYALVQFLEECNEGEAGVFKRYKWEIGGYDGRSIVPKRSLVDFTAINGPVWVAPVFSAIGAGQTTKNKNGGTRVRGLREDYQFNPKEQDRYIHVPRSFTDQSGWQQEVEVNTHWAANNNAQNLDAYILQNAIRQDNIIRSARDGKEKNDRPFDINIDFWKIIPPQDQWVEEIDLESEKDLEDLERGIGAGEYENDREEEGDFLGREDVLIMMMV